MGFGSRGGAGAGNVAAAWPAGAQPRRQGRSLARAGRPLGQALEGLGRRRARPRRFSDARSRHFCARPAASINASAWPRALEQRLARRAHLLQPSTSFSAASAAPLQGGQSRSPASPAALRARAISGHRRPGSPARRRPGLGGGRSPPHLLDVRARACPRPRPSAASARPRRAAGPRATPARTCRSVLHPPEVDPRHPLRRRHHRPRGRSRSRSGRSSTRTGDTDRQGQRLLGR